MLRAVFGLLLALACVRAFGAHPASAANSLHQNAVALTAETSSSPFVGLKWNISEANALFGDLGLNVGTVRDGGQTLITTGTSAVRFSLYFN